jgi:hypothetical protein
MSKARPCFVCGKMTSKFLFNDGRLDVAICSGKCEHQYIQTCDPMQEINMLRWLDGKIEKAKRDEKVCWTTAGAGLIIVAAGLFMSNATLFLIGVVPLTIGALFTRLFDDRQQKLTKKRKRIAI